MCEYGIYIFIQSIYSVDEICHKVKPFTKSECIHEHGLRIPIYFNGPAKFTKLAIFLC